jgi:mannosyltransferase
LPAGRWLRIGLVVVLVASVALRFITTSPMWLDEAQTVDIAHRSLPHLFSALREDGSPPLFYVLLHFWMLAFGTSSVAIRALSGLFSVASLPLIAVAAKRFGFSKQSRWAAVLILATCPFAVRYASEARMYSMVLFLVLLALIAYERVWTVGGWWPAIGAALVTGALLLTQYWSLFLLAAAGAAAIVAAWRGERRARRLIPPMVVGALLFVPWLPAFAYQSAHTGAPWGGAPGIDTPVLTLFDWSGDGFSGPLLGLLYFVLVALALAGRVGPTGGMTFGRPFRRTPLVLLGLALGTMLVGTLASEAISSAYSPRYSVIALAPGLLVAAAGFSALPGRARPAALALVCVLGLFSSALVPFQLRTQAAQVAKVLKIAGPHDLVVFCPDQLGPAVHRLAPNAGTQVVYPTFGSSAMVDWVNYKTRNANAHPLRFARTALQRAQGHTIWLVYANGYRTLRDSCLTLYTALTAARGQPITYLKASGRAFERDAVAAFRSR